MPFDANSSAQSDGSIWTTGGANSRQKRVMPSRSRRGGPGLGHCEVDVLILETQRRKFENEPLIPAQTSFLLTSHPKYAKDTLNDPESSININVVANERYFDRPDVLKAFREKAVIQTPEFESTSEALSGVGGRFRPRNQETILETSDAAYEKRHKKFENFEKRQRYREREKLKHEHYKLKERIEQLKAMDGSTFMTLPATSFTPPQQVAEDIEETTNSPYVSLNGGVYHVEGERRRKEMLDVAIKLEKRYSYLLPPRKVLDASSSGLRDTDSRDGEDSDTERDSGLPASKKGPKLRVQSVKSSTSTTPSASPAASRPLSKKSWNGTEPKRPGRRRQTSISTSTAPPEPVLSAEEKEKSPSPFIVVDSENDRLPSQLPPPPTPSQEDVSSPDDNHSPEPHPEQQVPFTIQEETQSVQDMPVETLEEEEPVETNLEEEQVPEPQREPILTMDHETGSPALADEKTQKVLSDAENNQELPSEALSNGGRPEMIIDTEEVEPQTAEAVTEPESTAEPEQPQRKKRRGRPKAPPKEIAAEQEMESLSTTRFRKRRLHVEENVAGPSRVMEEQPEVVSGIRLEGIPSQLAWTDPVFGPPAKRRRKNEVEFQVESISGASAHSPNRGIAAASAMTYPLRGKTHVSYVDSRTGKTIHTPSLLMVACARALEKTIVRRTRDNYSFGALTPDFGRGGEVEYELQEEILYGKSRDKSPDEGGSAVASEIADEPGENEDVDVEADPNDEDTEEEQVEDAEADPNSVGGAEEKEEEGEIDPTKEAEQASEVEEIDPNDEGNVVEEEQVPASENHQSYEELEVERGASGNHLEAFEPPSARDQNYGINPMERGYQSKYGLVYQGPYQEQLIASPEEDPMPEVPLGVRPRPRSRRPNYESDEEQLIW